MRPETHEAVDCYWANSLGCRREVLCEAGVSLVASDTTTVDVVRRGDSAVVAVDAERMSDIEATLSDSVVDDVMTRERLVGRLTSTGFVVADVLGPAFLGYADASTLLRAEAETGPPVRTLTSDDEAAYERFRAACPKDEWDAGGSLFHPGRTVGQFVGDELVALASYDIWAETIAHIAVITHPDHRNEGHAQAVVLAIAHDALAASLIPQYRTLDAWPWSVRVAEKLGFERWGTSLLVRLA